MSETPHVVIVGGGFGGLLAARALKKAPLRVTLVDRRNHHLFQPLLYQVATGGLSPANIATPLRALVKSQRNTRTLLAEVTGFDLDGRRVILRDGELTYDYLVVAAGAGQSYFGHDEWADWAPGLKSIEDATRIRRQVLLAFERAEREEDAAKREALLTFAVVGGGPTGVELAGAIAEVGRRTLRGEFRQADPINTRVLLIEGEDRLLQAFPLSLSKAAARGLERLGVEVRTRCMVEGVTSHSLRIHCGGDDGSDEEIVTSNVLWAAGVQASPLGKLLGEASEAEVDRGGRVVVEADCSLAGRPEVFVIGDMASYRHDVQSPLPGLAPVAMQQGRYVAKVIRARLRGRTVVKPFHYTDKGNMATIGRKMAVCEIGTIRFSGFFAWLAWLFVHLLYLAEFENRVLVLMQWGWNYVTRNRSARLITEVPEKEVETLSG